MTLKETFVAQIYSKEEEGIKGMKKDYKIFVPEHLNFKKGDLVRVTLELIQHQKEK
jgi:hypothetical protein